MTSPAATVVIALPIADRRRAMDFYRDALGLATIGEPAEDGVPEPLQLRLDSRTSLMLIPTGGFGWAIGGREVAAAGVSECLLSMSVTTEQEATDIVERARRAGGDVVTEPEHLPWGYCGIVADPDGHLWQIIA